MIRRRSKQIIAALLLAALATSCSPEQDEIPGGSNEGGLRFEVQMANNWSSTSTGATSRAPIEGTAFPGSEAGTKYEIGISILKDNGVGYMTGAHNIRAELTVKTHSPAIWRYQLNDDGIWLDELPRTGLSQALTISAYYPYYKSALIQNSRTHTTFYLANSSERTNQTDVLYTTPKALNPDGVNVLDFKHFYALFEFQLKKPAALNGTNDVITLNSVSFANAYGKGWVANQGWYDAHTGIPDENTLLIGPINRTGLNLTLKPATNTTLTDPAYQAVQVMVPPRAAGVMDSYADGNIQVHFDFGTTGMASFDIARTWLFQNGSNGITGGRKYTFQLLYDPRPEATVALTVTGWGNQENDENIGMTPPTLEFASSSIVKTGTFNGEPHTITTATSSSYNSYALTGINAVNNGGYKADITACLTESPYQKLEIAKTDERESSKITFTRDEAWNLCKNKTTDGGGWRLPRLSEGLLLLLNRATLYTNTPDFVDLTNQKVYWSGTEVNSTQTFIYNPYRSDVFYAGGYANTTPLSVRCVREVE